MAHYRQVTSRAAAAVDLDDAVDDAVAHATPVRAVADVDDRPRSVSALARERHAGPGRPSKLSPELQDAICADVARGMPPVAAARRNGLHRATYHRWMAAGLDAARRSDAEEPVSESDLRFCDFCDAIERAELDYQASLLHDILTLARPRTVRRVAVKQELLRDRGRLVYDDNGAPIMVSTCQVIETEVADAAGAARPVGTTVPDRARFRRTSGCGRRRR